jgi:hypothetical protein
MSGCLEKVPRYVRQENENDVIRRNKNPCSNFIFDIMEFIILTLKPNKTLTSPHPFPSITGH